MNCIRKTQVAGVTAFVVLIFAAGEGLGVPLTLSFVPEQSYVTLTGMFSGQPLLSQEGRPGVTDLNLTRPSNQTTFQGTITVDVDNVIAPTSIKILSSAADADVGGLWLPEVEPYLDLDMDGRFGEFGADSLPTAGDSPAPATAADWGIRVFISAFGVDAAWGGYRDIVYNVTSASESVNALGEFSSLSENFEFTTGWLDYWVAQGLPGGNLRGRAEMAGGDDNNQSALASTYTVTSLPGNKAQIRLFLPIHIDDMGTDLRSFYDGQFVATLIIPESSTLVLLSLGTVFTIASAPRRRKQLLT